MTITEEVAAGVVEEEEEVATETGVTTADDHLPPTTAAGEGAATTGPDLALTLLVSIVVTKFCNLRVLSFGKWFIQNLVRKCFTILLNYF